MTWEETDAVSPALASTTWRCYHGRRECWWPTASVSSTCCDMAVMTWEETDAVGHQHSRLQHDNRLLWHGRKLMLWVTSTRVYNMMTWLSQQERKLMLWVTSTRVYNMITWLSQPGNWCCGSPALASTTGWHGCHKAGNMLFPALASTTWRHGCHKAGNWCCGSPASRLQHEDMAAWHGRRECWWPTSISFLITWLLWHGHETDHVVDSRLHDDPWHQETDVWVTASRVQHDNMVVDAKLCWWLASQHHGFQGRKLMLCHQHSWQHHDML